MTVGFSPTVIQSVSDLEQAMLRKPDDHASLESALDFIGNNALAASSSYTIDDLSLLMLFAKVTKGAEALLSLIDFLIERA
mmetsp:Transcript_11367/g.15282  ORF Transcript_11367/g.15282 Transcript_11367/m.15282 type:complete len:81 (+) Transcript_11367:420-662(+)|eukprot:CAMPEP_0185599732 /NCGR_PEP_ID=MMETSP0434-20130131/82902_1 /TAXON_ID=626734 ORGANISM="Favella taraikaensis, Strain Fe Narragansett Bay" /NCGR_SAMPLE_ID=MMETSP0434 /ASSEMBLY_ACC=CAM_ASM_000379 /LENGTH=80 /DNA_ID=CAMNT_0028229233 /DNA_START=395 /DNA_END=637 /DNA_ORIENTATION=-